ncbi:NS3 [Hirame aquareovirus]|nr:NS3 [Hirame aquareovirus]
MSSYFNTAQLVKDIITEITNSGTFVTHNELSIYVRDRLGQLGVSGRSDQRIQAAISRGVYETQIQGARQSPQNPFLPCETSGSECDSSDFVISDSDLDSDQWTPCSSVLSRGRLLPLHPLRDDSEGPVRPIPDHRFQSAQQHQSNMDGRTALRSGQSDVSGGCIADSSGPYTVCATIQPLINYAGATVAKATQRFRLTLTIYQSSIVLNIPVFDMRAALTLPGNTRLSVIVKKGELHDLNLAGFNPQAWAKLRSVVGPNTKKTLCTSKWYGGNGDSRVDLRSYSQSASITVTDQSIFLELPGIDSVGAYSNLTSLPIMCVFEE